MVLRHGGAKHGIVEDAGRNVAPGKLRLGRMRGEFERMEMREASLPAREGRAPMAP
jgi:hypothetical protein